MLYMYYNVIRMDDLSLPSGFLGPQGSFEHF